VTVGDSTEDYFLRVRPINQCAFLTMTSPLFFFSLSFSLCSCIYKLFGAFSVFLKGMHEIDIYSFDAYKTPTLFAHTVSRKGGPIPGSMGT